MSKRTDYHRKYYQERSEELSERRQENRDKFERCVSYWRQKLSFNRDIPGLKAGCSDDTVAAAKQHYQKLLGEPVEVETK